MSISTRSGRSLARQREPVLGRRGLERPVADVLEHVAHQLHVPRVVLDDQDHGAPSSTASPCDRSRAGDSARPARRARPALNVALLREELICPFSRSRCRAAVMSFEVRTTIGTSATVRVGPEPLDDLEAVDVGHQQVEQDHGRPLARGRAATPSSPPAARSTDQPCGLERRLDELEVARVVVDRDDGPAGAGRRTHARERARAARRGRPA